MKYESRNPATGELIQAFDFDNFPDVSISKSAFRNWRKLSIEERNNSLQKVAKLIVERKNELAHLITLEMGKPLSEAEHEVEKTLTLFDFYSKNAEQFLRPQYVETTATQSYLAYEPLGIIFSIMPWNFPLWQALRFAVPALYAGNVAILKHAPSVPQCAKAIEQLFHDAGLENGVFKNYFLTNEDAAKLMENAAIAGVSFTGSDATGSIIASQAGKSIKKVVMELGGNDPFIVFKDADLESAVNGAIKSRSINAGQACNGAKRFIVVKEIAKEFTQKLIEKVNQLKVGNPLESTTQIGPLARKDLQQKVLQQIKTSVEQGAVAHVSPQQIPQAGNYVSPTVLTNVQPGVLAFEEEVFGPVFSIVEASDEQDAINLANNSKYGLSASIWSANVEHVSTLISEIEVGNVFVNEVVRSNAHLPFGGVKHSGFGREMGEAGLKEFVNIKTVFIK